MRLQTTLLGITALLTGISCTDKTPAPVGSITGVWANADCELLRTDRFALLFERSDSTITATLHLMDNGDTILLGKSRFSPDSVLMQQVWSKGDVQQPVDLGTLQADGTLHIAVNGREQQLEKIEEITITSPYEMPHAATDQIGSCVQEWCLGAMVNQNEGSLSFNAGTNRHNYSFNIGPGMIYCRAARIRYNDFGALFAQNIRMMSNANTGEHTCEMGADNRMVSAAPLTIDNTKFKPDQCFFSDEGIYWSFIRFDGDTAVLNGCGDIYRFDRPTREGLAEWYTFVKY